MLTAPLDVMKAQLVCIEAPVFVARYENVHQRLVTEFSALAKELHDTDKKTRDRAVVEFLRVFTDVILGKPDEQPWPIVAFYPYHLALVYQHEVLRLLAAKDVGINDFFKFINTVYFPGLLLEDFQQALYTQGIRPAFPTEERVTTALLVFNQLLLLGTQGALALNPAVMAQLLQGQAPEGTEVSVPACVEDLRHEEGNTRISFIVKRIAKAYHTYLQEHVYDGLDTIILHGQGWLYARNVVLDELGLAR